MTTSASNTWAATVNGSTGALMGGTIQELSKKWYFWVIVGLVVLCVVLFIWAVVVTYQKYKLTEDASSTYRRRAKAGRYMADPGIPASKPSYLPGGGGGGYRPVRSRYAEVRNPQSTLQHALRQ